MLQSSTFFLSLIPEKMTSLFQLSNHGPFTLFTFSFIYLFFDCDHYRKRENAHIFLILLFIYLIQFLLLQIQLLAWMKRLTDININLKNAYYSLCIPFAFEAFTVCFKTQAKQDDHVHQNYYKMIQRATENIWPFVQRVTCTVSQIFLLN